MSKFVNVLPRHTADDRPITLDDHRTLAYIAMAKPRVVIDAMKKIGCHRVMQIEAIKQMRRTQPLAFQRFMEEARAAQFEIDVDEE